MKNMKKVLFLMLFLVVLGTANINSQVRIGGDGEPYAAAVLDLNVDDSDTPTGNKGGLALPRISLEALSGEDANLNGMAPIAGMLVYNTNTTLGEGVYFWDGSMWIIISGDGIVGNEVTNATTGGGLVRSGSGTAASPFTLGINTGGVTSDMIKAGSITSDKLANNSVSLTKTTLKILNIDFSAIGNTAGSYLELQTSDFCTAPNLMITANSYDQVSCQIRSTRYTSATRLTSGTRQVLCTLWCFQ